MHRYSGLLLLTMALLCGVVSAAGEGPANPAATPAAQQLTESAIAERVFAQEAQLIRAMQQYSPIVETYVQNLKPDSELGRVPKEDKYFMGKLVLGKVLQDKSFQKQPRFGRRILDRLNEFYKMNYLPLGFMQLVYLNDFNKNNYDLKFVRRQFLGDVRCVVFDVTPKPHLKGVHFLGRIWAEDQDFNIVRLNGAFAPQSTFKYFFHFDSWRINVRPGLWLPAYIYTEESDAPYFMFRKLMMKAQTRFWGYELSQAGKQEQLTDILVDAPPSDVVDKSTAAANESNPTDSAHMWQRQAEDNVLEKLQRAGVLAPDGEVSKVLQTVVNNLEITNKLDVQPEVRCRVLLTTPLESFTVGHTIVISRGLLDVLPDEASLAMVLAHELGHIVLGSNLDTKYAFSDRVIFPDEESFQRITIPHSDHDEQIADQKGLEYLKNSPYKDKLANAGLFLRALEQRWHQLPSLISPHFGDRMIKGTDAIRMAALMQAAPALKTEDVDQRAALPLGSRIKLNPWDDQLDLQKSKPVPLLSSREKMPFEVTPFWPNLARYKEAPPVSAAARP